MRILGVTLADGFSSEVRVASTVLGGGDLEVMMITHAWPGDTATPKAIEKQSGARVVAIDAGWRPTTTPRWRRGLGWGQLGSQLPKLWQLARQFQPDAVYSSQQRWDCALATVLAESLRVPQIIHLHYIIGAWLGWLPLARLPRAALVVAVSKFIRERAISHGVAASRVHAVWNAAPIRAQVPTGERDAVRRELGADSGEVVIGMVGRVTQTKGQREALEAFSKILRNGANARLVFVGTGDAVAGLEARRRELDLGERVQFLGARSDVPRLLSGFDAFVHPSYEDPCPLAVLEAQAAALPVVAFAEGGIPEIVEDGTTGLLTPPRDVDLLAGALASLVHDAGLRASMGAAARHRMETTFTTEAARAGFREALRLTLSAAP